MKIKAFNGKKSKPNSSRICQLFMLQCGAISYLISNKLKVLEAV